MRTDEAGRWSARILRLNRSGHPVEWIRWQDAVCLYARGLVLWTPGAPILEVRGGVSRLRAARTVQTVHSIIACAGPVQARGSAVPPLTNRALFRRDRNTCLYCGRTCADVELTRDHVVPRSRGGRDRWDNVVTACRRCNHAKGNALPGEGRVTLLALPYVPNHAEYLALINSGRILGDQMDFLRPQFGRESRLRH